jgi:hypothetical protein
VKEEPPFAFCRELWVELQEKILKWWPRVNNAVCLFSRGNRILDFYIDACESIVRWQRELNPLAVGTNFLTGLSRVMPIPLIDSVATLAPAVLQPLACGKDGALREYRRMFAALIRAANLCGSLCDKPCQNTVLRESDYDRAIDRLLSGAASD